MPASIPSTRHMSAWYGI